MRALVVSGPGLGHGHPVLPLARSLERAEHEMLVATSEAVTRP